MKRPDFKSFYSLPFLLCAFFFLIAASFGIIAAGEQMNSGQGTFAERAARLHKSSIICDLHADTLTRARQKKLSFIRGAPALQIDLPKLKAGNIALTTQAIWVLHKGLRIKPTDYVNFMLDSFDKLMADAADSMRPVRSFRDFEQARRDGKIAVVLTIEDGRAIGGNVETLRNFYQRGVRGMSLTWNLNNDLATSAWEARHRKGQGLTGKGRQVVREMAKLGMMIDISHASPETLRDVLKEVNIPIYASHSCAYGINPHWRNLRDWQIKAIAERGGVIGVNFFSKHLRKDGKIATPPDVARHIAYIVKLAGVDTVAIGSDYDGDIDPPRRLENISKMQALTEELLQRGYSEEDVKKILGGNFLRFFKTICP